MLLMDLPAMSAGTLPAGLLATRTRLFGNDLDIQRGLSVGYYTGPLSLYGSTMNFGFGDA